MSSNSNATVSMLQAHTSVRKFNQRQFTREEVAELVKTAQCAATSNFRQAYSLVWIRDEEKRKKVGELACNALQYETCGAAFVICVDFARLAKACEIHGTEIMAASAENLLLGCADAAIFAQNLVVAAEAKGLGTCYIGGVRTNIEPIADLLNLPDLVFPLFGLTIGEPGAALNAVKPRLPLEAVLFEDSYNTEAIEPVLRQFDEELNVYYKTRTSNPKDTTWTQDMSAVMCKHMRPHIKGFLAKKGFTFL